jgi:hypothetical protein
MGVYVVHYVDRDAKAIGDTMIGAGQAAEIGRLATDQRYIKGFGVA